MKITIRAIGKTKTEFFEPAISHYQKRLARWVVMEWKTIPASNKSRESELLIAGLPSAAYVILLDERGSNWDTADFAAKLEDIKNHAYKQLVFIIGGAYGVDQMVVDRANDVMSMSKLVFPHEQVRLMITEQLYRAYDLNAGGNYHHI